MSRPREDRSRLGDTADQSTELQKVLRQLEFRMAVTTAILSTLDLEEVLYVILSGITAGDGLGFNRAFLFLEDDHGRTLRVRLAVGPPSHDAALRIWREMIENNVNFNALLPRFEAFRGDESCRELTRRLQSFVLPLNRLETLAASPHVLILHSRASLVEVMARCLINRAPFCSNALSLFHEIGGTAGELFEFRNVAIVPLCAGRRLIGAIVADNVYSGGVVDSDTLRALHALGNLAALAIDRARLHARTVAMAEVDGLTGVYNRRYYEEELGRAMVSAARGGQPLSIVVFDIDHFKQVNDARGHLVGDEVLKGVARLLTQHVRQSDLVARYGGEEFVVLLKDTGPDDAVQVAEKLRQRVKDTAFDPPGLPSLTLSAGVAAARAQQGETAVDLFVRADRALYRAKAEGRDRVVLWTDALGTGS